jgi:hypothetical protein
MANLTAYGTGTPKASDLLLGTKTATPNTNEKNITQNFTISGVAAFANSYSLGYTVYTAALLQTGTSAPVATVLQNTTGGTFTWLYADVGKSQIAVSGITLPANKVAIFMSSSTGNLGLGGKITTTTQIDVEQFSSGGGGYADGMSAGTSIEIRIYI